MFCWIFEWLSLYQRLNASPSRTSQQHDLHQQGEAGPHTRSYLEPEHLLLCHTTDLLWCHPARDSGGWWHQLLYITHHSFGNAVDQLRSLESSYTEQNCAKEPKTSYRTQDIFRDTASYFYSAPEKQNDKQFSFYNLYSLSI